MNVQVEAALTNDPENQELVKLKTDLTVRVVDRACCVLSIFNF
jgi:50S ribosomal subunit-associated GTPase HflX